MIRLLNVVLLAIAVLSTQSCSKESMGDVYSSLGAEQDKNMLDLSTRELNDELAKLGETDFAAVCTSMSKRLEGKIHEGKMSFFASIIEIGKLMNENQTADCYFDELTSITFNEKGQCNALNEEGYGIWQWDEQTQAFIKVKEHATEIIFKFPATDALDGDTACLTITDLEINSNNFPNKGNVLENGTTITEVLSTLRLNMKVKNELILTSNISNQVDEDGNFKIVGMTFNPKPFTFTGEMGYEDNNGYWILAVNNDTKSIIEHNLKVRFDTSNDNMSVRNLTNSLSINTITLITEAYTGEIYNKLQELEEFPEDSEKHAKTLADALNKYATLTARYTSNNTIIAKVDAVAKRDTKVTKQDVWWVDLEFIFSDGFRVSGEEYYDGYLTTFKVDLEKLVSEFESKFGV